MDIELFDRGRNSETVAVTYHSRVGRHVVAFLVIALHLFVHHKLNGSVRNTEESRKKSSVKTFNTFVAVSLDQRIHYSAE